MFGRVGLGAELVVGASRPPRTRDDEWTAALARLSVEDEGLKPGVLPLGFGVVGNSIRTPDGTMWLTLPWAGEVLKVRLRDE